MTFDRAEFAKQQKVKAVEARAKQRGELIQLRQAALAAEHMTGTPEWDTFLSYLEAAKLETVRLRNAYQAQLSDARIVDPNEITKIRIAVFRLNERIQTLAMVITMPSDIRKHGRIADERLKELEMLDGEIQAA